MASSDIRLTKEQVRKSKQDACREISCHSPGICPFCPHISAGKEVTKK